MVDTSARLLRLLTVLQARRFWCGAELAERLEVTPRTLRRDIERLRSLGYAVTASVGVGGGYRLDGGRALPPLLLEDEEALAVVIALRSAVDTVAGMGDAAMSALLKLNQLLPARLRDRLSALHAVTVSVADRGSGVDPQTLTLLAQACREGRQLRLDYEDRAGRASHRKVEPLRLAHTGNRRWYLVAWDVDRGEWRTLRVDRIRGSPVTGAPFTPRPPPADVGRYVSEAISHAPYPHRARFLLAGSLEELKQRLPPWIGALTPEGESHTLLTVGADSAQALVCLVLLCGVDFTLLEPEELRPCLRQIAARLASAV